MGSAGKLRSGKKEGLHRARNTRDQGEVNEKVCDLVSIRESELPIERGVLAENRGQETERSLRKDLEIGANSIQNNDINIK